MQVTAICASSRQADKGRGGRVPHRLYAIHARGGFFAGSWVVDAGAVLAEARGAKSLPIFTGGSGLYFKACAAGVRGAADPGRRARSVRAGSNATAVEALRPRLAHRDPRICRTPEPRDRTTSLAPL